MARYAGLAGDPEAFRKCALSEGAVADGRGQWRGGDPSFRRRPIVGQLFDEAQFECYRALGHKVVGVLCELRAPKGYPDPRDSESISAWFAALPTQLCTRAERIGGNLTADQREERSPALEVRRDCLRGRPPLNGALVINASVCRYPQGLWCNVHVGWNDA